MYKINHCKIKRPYCFETTNKNWLFSKRPKDVVVSGCRWFQVKQLLQNPTKLWHSPKEMACSSTEPHNSQSFLYLQPLRPSTPTLHHSTPLHPPTPLPPCTSRRHRGCAAPAASRRWSRRRPRTVLWSSAPAGTLGERR